MIRRLGLIAAVAAGGWSMGVGNAAELNGEARIFLEKMAPGWQQKQTAAIRQARFGDLTALTQIREARNLPARLPDSVEALELADNMRLYRKKGLPVGNPLPVLLYFHGGGWTIGSVESCAAYCSELAASGQAVVVALDYKLAPEHPYPAGLNDCREALRWCRQHIAQWGGDPERISLGGDSSGGNLALATALAEADEAEIRSLILFYPVTLAWEDASESWAEFASGFGLDAAIMTEFNAAYTSAEAARSEKLISPGVAAAAEIAGLPPVLLVAAECDILRDQGRNFAELLRQNGVACRYECIAGSVHLFVTVPGQPEAFQRCVTLSAEFLRDDKKGSW